MEEQEFSPKYYRRVFYNNDCQRTLLRKVMDRLNDKFKNKKMTKEQELQMNNYYEKLVKEGKLKTLQEAYIFKLSYEKAFSLKDVVASVLCVDSSCYGALTKYCKYRIIKEDNINYTIINDYDEEFRYPKVLFVKSYK